MTNENILIAFGLTLFAGLSTGIGSTIAFFAKKTNTKFLSVALGFSAGVMIYVSLVEIFVKAKDALTEALGKVAGNWATVGAFFGGIAFIAIQKKRKTELGRGAEFSEERARLYLSMDAGRLKLVKAKNWRTEVNPNCVLYTFKLIDGCTFIDIEEKREHD